MFAAEDKSLIAMIIETIKVESKVYLELKIFNAVGTKWQNKNKEL